MKGLKKTNKKKETQNIDSSPISEIFETSLDDAYLLLDLPNPNIIHNETDYDTSDSGLKYPSNDPELFHVAQILLQSSMSMDSSTDSSTSRFLDETSSVDSSDSKGKKERKKRKDPVTGRTCDYCKSTQTPLWRHGPPGYDDLCNKCGVKWMRGKILQDVMIYGSWKNDKVSRRSTIPPSSAY